MEFVIPLQLTNSSPAQSTWHKLKERFTDHCSAPTSEVSSDNSIFNTIAGSELSDIFSSNFLEVKENVKISILQKIEELCLPKFILLLDRSRFFMHSQKKGEKMSKFLCNLEFLAELSDLSEEQGELIKDQIVEGVACQSLRRQLRNIDNLSKKRAKLTCKRFPPCAKACCRAPKCKFKVAPVREPTVSDNENEDATYSPSSPEVTTRRQLRSTSKKKKKKMMVKIKSGKKRGRPPGSTCKMKKQKPAPPPPEELSLPPLQDTTLDLSHLSANDKLIKLYDQLTSHLDILADYEETTEKTIDNSQEEDEKLIKACNDFCSEADDDKILNLVPSVEEVLDDDDEDSRTNDLSVVYNELEQGEADSNEALPPDPITLDMGTHLNFSEKLSRMFGAKDELRETLIMTKKLDPTVELMTEEEYESNFLETLQNHVVPEKRNKNPNECEFCEMVLPIKKHMLKHLHAAHPDKFPHKCTQCKAMYMRPRNLVKHIKASHSKRRIEKVICDQCGSVFSDASKLTKHIYRVHTIGKKFECDICHKRLASKDGLTYHLRVHRNERPYVCEVCGAEHANQGNLKRHIKWRHQGIKPHKCNDCGKAFIQLAQKVLHVRRYHTKETPFSCKECGAAFYSKYDLKVHNRKHTGEKPYSCEICGKGFRVGIQLNRHMQTHTGQKSFNCDSCDSKFSRLSNLKCHKRTVHGNVAEQVRTSSSSSMPPVPPIPNHTLPPPQVYPPPPQAHTDNRMAVFPTAQMDPRQPVYAHAAHMEPPREPVFPHPQMDMSAAFPRPHHYDQGMNRVATSPHTQGLVENRAPVFPYPDPQWNRPVWLQPL